jgi:hypothetical protein
MKKQYLILTVVFTFVLFFAAAPKSNAQKSPQTVGNISLTVQPVNIAGSDAKYSAAVPVNEKLPLLQGESIGVDVSHGEQWKLETFAVGDKNSNEGAVLTLTLTVDCQDGEEAKVIQEKIKLLKNQITEFSLKVDQVEFKVSAVYQ